ncbi:MAG: hypothetical protein ABI551_11825 [Polyangiaceae bacterium]
MMVGRGRAVLGLALVCGSFAVGCGSAGDSELGDSTQDVKGTVYANLYDVLQGTDFNDWITARNTLKNDFYQICGDTMCAGDFRNWNTVTLDCSASRNTKKMSQCLWTFAGSQEFVSGYSGKVTADIPVITCTIPVKGTASDFVKALKASALRPAIQSIVPGGTKTYYDYVADCFQNVPEKIPAPTKTQTYHNASVTLGDDNPDSWYPGVGKIDDSFDQICGDTFCEGDYTDIDALGFECAVSNAGNVKNCSLSLAGAYTEVGSYGVITAHTKTWTCPISFAGKTATLVGFLAGADPYNATLPGSTTTIHDALVDCL